MESSNVPRLPRLTSSLVFTALAAVLLPAGLRAQAANPCSPSPAVKEALDKLPQQTPAETDWEFHQQRLAAIQALLRQHPDDVFVQRAYIDAMSPYGGGGSFADRTRAINEYKARHEKNPDDAHLDYFYGYALVGRDSPGAIKLFQAALERDAQFPWPHLSLVTIYNSPAFLNKKEALANAKAFLEACPTTFAGYEPFTESDDKQLISQAGEKLRALVKERSDPDAVTAYQTLWALEFKAHPPSEYGPLREQVQKDLARLRTINLQNKREWWQTLEDGYKLVNDKKDSDWAKQQRQTRFPDAEGFDALENWQEDHQYPAEDAPADQKRAYFSELLGQSAQWIKAYPHGLYIWMDRLDAMEHLPDLPATEVEAAADQEVRVAELSGGPEGANSDAYFNAAEVLTKRHLEPERVVELARKGLAKLETETKEPYYDLYGTKDNVADQKFYQAYARLNGMQFEVDGLIDLTRTEQAELKLQQINERLDDLKSLAGDKQDRKQSYAGELAGYWFLMARAAALQGHKLDAMAFYENALLTRLDAKIKPETGVPDELADKAHALWTSLGGSADGWKEWYGRPAEALANQATLTWNDANDPLPSFNLADLNGKTWNLAEVKGKTVFLNFWASW